ncbi:hypothetical protein GKE43_03565 [[Eubacterium] rectale]|nr:hypothetical protein [Agathobacter rectalis]
MLLLAIYRKSFTHSNFKIFFSISLACSMIYSFCREKYFPMQTVSKTEKYVSIILIILLFLRFLFLKN